jgi:hypothetical protein
MLGKLFDAWPSQVYRWVVQAGLSLPERPISGEIREMEFDEMRHFIQETCQKILESFHLRKKQALGHQGR